MRNEIDKKGLAWFLALAFIPTIAVSLILRDVGTDLADKTMAYYSVALATVMFFPGISAFIVRKFITKEGFKDAGLRIGPKKPYLQVAVFIPLLFIVIYAITGLFYSPDFTLETFMAQAGIEETPMEPTLFIAVLFFSTLIVTPLINSIPAFGEEFGWRGYLLPKLMPLGREKALVFSGIIWGIWHMPFVFLIGFGGYPDRLAGGLVFVAVITLLGIYIGALTLKNDSVVLASFMHGVFNAQAYGIWTIVYPDYNRLIGGIGGLIGIIVLLPVAVYYLREK
ncbi:CPBP family intramembrane metalloprotease [Methanosarcina sp. KYL-1]|uniref:CPBP family intramembrane glutamic endopeptidase n=1 Tax=Methanosarcina sp. KYL-1 TaxID=2602068 RepID=UPI00210122FF|nr:CPBP family intramembrane glutamic endopeptidase [Methanosarcina sp. KYL-1]MCQ1536424.1 CPBP family intramembrane metalloprotease [Methanosarcina sp. KYL-1]